jgi:hypothetical protein
MLSAGWALLIVATFETTNMREVFISNSGGVTTICGNRISNGKVWIKVCNSHSQSLNGAQKSGAEAPQFSFGK